MRNNLFYLILIFSVLLTSCGGKMEKIDTEIQYFNDIQISKDKSQIEKDGLMPELYELSKPVNIDKVDYVFSPLSIKRLDIGKKIELDYLTKKGRNYKKINAIIRAHREYFKDGKDTEVDPSLIAPFQQKIDFDAYVTANKSKPNYFFIDFNGNLKIDGEEAPSSVEQLSRKIEKYIESKQVNDKKSKKSESEVIGPIVIVVTPSYYEAKQIEMIPEPTKESALNTTIPVKEKPETIDKPIEVYKAKTEKANETAVQIAANSAQDFILKVNNRNISDNKKQAMIDNYTKFFTTDAIVVIVDNNGIPLDFKSIKSYISIIRGSGRNIQFQSEGIVMSGNKYQKLNVRHP